VKREVFECLRAGTEACFNHPIKPGAFEMRTCQEVVDAAKGDCRLIRGTRGVSAETSFLQKAAKGPVVAPMRPWLEFSSARPALGLKATMCCRSTQRSDRNPAGKLDVFRMSILKRSQCPQVRLSEVPQSNQPQPAGQVGDPRLRIVNRQPVSTRTPQRDAA